MEEQNKKHKLVAIGLGKINSVKDSNPKKLQASFTNDYLNQKFTLLKVLELCIYYQVKNMSLGN